MSIAHLPRLAASLALWLGLASCDRGDARLGVAAHAAAAVGGIAAIAAHATTSAHAHQDGRGVATPVPGGPVWVNQPGPAAPAPPPAGPDELAAPRRIRPPGPGDDASGPRWTSALDNLGFDEHGRRPARDDDDLAAPAASTTTVIVVVQLPPAPVGPGLGLVLDDPGLVPLPVAGAGVLPHVASGAAAGTGTTTSAGVTVRNRPGTALQPGVPPTVGTPRSAAMPRYPTAGPTGAVGGRGTAIGTTGR